MKTDEEMIAFLQNVGLAGLVITFVVIFLCFRLYDHGKAKGKAGEYGVLAMALFMTYMGIFSTWVMTLPGYVQGQ